jgi:alkaline phosphatase
MSLTRREILAGSACAAVTLFAGKALGVQAERPLKIGFITDAHYADADSRGSRHYRESIDKLREAVEVFRREGVDHIVECGDLIDAANNSSAAIELRFLKTINAELAKAEVPRSYVLGNHCLAALTKDQFLGAVGQKESWYSFDKNGWHIVILDACFRRDETPYSAGNFAWTDTEIPLEERRWLRRDLAQTDKPTLVFVHQRIDKEPKNFHAIHSGKAVRQILHESGKVAAVFQGHNHINEHRQLGKISYLTMAAMVEGSGEENSCYSILTCEADGQLTLTGYRKHANHPFQES